MLKFQTYAENIRWAAKTRENPHGKPVSIRNIADAIGVCYETVRKIYMGKGKLYLSRITNADLCSFLGLPVDEMWALAQAEKFSQKAGYVPMKLVEDREGREVSALWQRLGEEERKTVLRMVRSFSSHDQQPGA